MRGIPSPFIKIYERGRDTPHPSLLPLLPSKNLFDGVLGFRRRPVLLAEFIDAAAGIYNFLLARVERMAIGAHFDLQIMADRRAGLELIAAGAGDGDDFIFWMDTGFHRNLDKSNGRIDEPAKGAPPRLDSPPKIGPNILSARWRLRNAPGIDPFASSGN